MLNALLCKAGLSQCCMRPVGSHAAGCHTVCEVCKHDDPKAPSCDAESGDGFSCSRDKWHKGLHHAHGIGTLYEEWR